MQRRNQMNQIVNNETVPPPSAENLIALIAILMLFGIGGWIISGVLHEIGHALAVLSFGGIITDFQPFVLEGAPHISYAHPSFAGRSHPYFSRLRR